MKLSYDISIIFTDETVLNGQQLGLQAVDGGYAGTDGNISLRLRVGSSITAAVENRSGRCISAIRWEITCCGKDIAHCRVPLPCSVRHSGVVALQEQTPASTLFTGLFYGADRPCLFLGTKLPQNNLHQYQVSRVNDDTVTITGTTQFTAGQSAMVFLETETTLLFTGSTPLQAMEAYAGHLPDLPAALLPDPMIGWNSWDYYFTTVSSAAVRENLEFIRNDPILSKTLKAVVVDDGWETCVGEWYANHRFPEGLAYLAELIQSYGLIPGIWTNGAQTESLCEPALRHPEYYILDDYGIPFTVDGKQVLDPTHPEAETFIFDTYRRLYNAGFRIFKVDFISTILEGKRFYDKTCGPYEAVRRLLRLIRRAVGPDSHIVGCAFPAECGPGVVDSSRISVDIHNHWLHALWILEYLQARFWMNGKLFRSDPDMLIVRGSETSLESETNVFNPWNLVPPGQDRFSSRWRRGPVFNLLEAETWANIVVFSGGDIMLGDRLAMLNRTGLDLVYSHLQPHMHAAVPLDLGDQEVSELWYDSHTAQLLLINTREEARTIEVPFARYGLTEPAALSCGKPHRYSHGTLTVSLQPHESAVIQLT